MNHLWQPFVPGVGANAQYLLNAAGGAAIDFILVAGWHCGNRYKPGQIFCQRTFHYLPSIPQHTEMFTIPRELEYEPDKYWRTDFRADSDGKQLLDALFQVRSDGGLQIELSAANPGKKPVEWGISLFYGPNEGACQEEGRELSLQIADTMGMQETAPFFGGEHPDGLLAAWGTTRDLKHYPKGLTPRFVQISLKPGESLHEWIFIGKGTSQCIPEVPVCSLGDAKPDAFRHLETQLKITRAFPTNAGAKSLPVASYTPCAHMDWPFLWDAGFIATGLAVNAPEAALECIEQYLPGGAVWNLALGAIVPTQIMAALELVQQTGRQDLVKRLYPGLRKLWRQAVGLETWCALSSCELDEDQDGLLSAPGGGSGLDDAPSQIWARGNGVDWARQENYWGKPIKVNPTGGLVETESVNMTAFAILAAKILRQFCPQEADEYNRYITKAEAALQRYCWNEATGHFHWVTGKEHAQTPYYDLSGLTPLFSGTWKNEAQRDCLLHELFSKYMTRRGLTTVWPKADFYRVGYWCGSIWIPFHWMFWKQLIGMGKFQEAAQMAERIVATWLKVYGKQPFNFEKFDLATGEGSGSLEFGGLAAVLLNLYGACHPSDYRCVGWNTIVRKWKVSSDKKEAELELVTETDCGARIMLLPKQAYCVKINGRKMTITADKAGGVDFVFPPGKVFAIFRNF